MRAERSHQVRHQVMRQWPLFRDVPHEHGDRAPDCLVDVNDKNFVVVPKEHGTSPARRQNRANLHLDDRFIHAPERMRSDCEIQEADDQRGSFPRFYEPGLACSNG